ncbi:hypothetical protein CDS [Bradyrhizobium sp.]|nr:hypothetical protein CDS [Bradyrhizobium sp.]
MKRQHRFSLCRIVHGERPILRATRRQRDVAACGLRTVMLQTVTLEIGLRKPGLKTPPHYLGRTSAHPLPGRRA